MIECSRTILTALLVVVVWGGGAKPAGLPEARPVYAIQNAKVYTLAGPPIDGATVLVRDGKIGAVGTQVTVPSGAQVIDAKGLEVYPGLFDAFTDLGLTEIGAVEATVDTSEIGPYNPQLVAATAVHPASELIPVARANGITHALSVPDTGGSAFFGGGGTVMPGHASVIHLAGWTVEEMLVRPSVAMVLNWPTLIVTTGDPLAIPTQVRYLFIRGQLTSVDNRQHQLYEKYRKRP